MTHEKQLALFSSSGSMVLVANHRLFHIAAYSVFVECDTTVINFADYRVSFSATSPNRNLINNSTLSVDPVHLIGFSVSGHETNISINF